MGINNNKRKVIGQLNKSITEQLNIDLPNEDVLLYKGAERHIKKKHEHCLKYLDRIDEVINNPDYIGTHPNESNSIELVKVFDKNILVAVKLATEGYLFVSSMYDISEGKLNNRLNNERLKRFIDK